MCHKWIAAGCCKVQNYGGKWLVRVLWKAPPALILSNCLGRSCFDPKRPILHHTSPIFSSDAPHRTQKLANLTLNCLLFGLKTADLNSYIFDNIAWVCISPSANHHFSTYRTYRILCLRRYHLGAGFRTFVASLKIQQHMKRKLFLIQAGFFILMLAMLVVSCKTGKCDCPKW
jgi:hypothetical protein